MLRKPFILFLVLLVAASLSKSTSQKESHRTGSNSGEGNREGCVRLVEHLAPIAVPDNVNRPASSFGLAEPGLIAAVIANGPIPAERQPSSPFHTHGIVFNVTDLTDELAQENLELFHCEQGHRSGRLVTGQSHFAETIRLMADTQPLESTTLEQEDNFGDESLIEPAVSDESLIEQPAPIRIFTSRQDREAALTILADDDLDNTTSSGTDVPSSRGKSSGEQAVESESRTNEELLASPPEAVQDERTPDAAENASENALRGPETSQRSAILERAEAIARSNPHLTSGSQGNADRYEGDPWHVPLERLTPDQQARKQRIRDVLEFYYNRQLNVVDDSPWSMMHHMLAWGSDSLIWTGKPGGSQRVSCIGWLCANGVCEGERLLYYKNGYIYARSGPGLQGHAGQFLAILAQSRVPIEQPIRVDGKLFTVDDLIQQESLACRPATELTFRLIGLVHYLDTEANWESSDGELWDFPRLIQEEIRQPINGVTCGGTHRLMGMSYALRRRWQDQLPVDGEWARAAQYTAAYRAKTYAMQNRDGSFSSDFWRSQGNWGDIDRKQKTTGHILEWMVFSSPHHELEDPRLLRAIDYLTTLMVQNRYYDWGKGPLGHAIRALSLYDERVFGGVPGERDLRLAKTPPKVIPKSSKADESSVRSPSSNRRPLLFRRSGR